MASRDFDQSGHTGAFSDGLSDGERSGSLLGGKTDIRIGRDGTWYYHGSPITRKPLVKLFASVLQRDSSGGHWLVTPVERVRVAVDDAPFVAVAMTASGVGERRRLRFRTNLDHEIEAGSGRRIRVATNRENGQPSPYIEMEGGLEALIARSIFYDLVDLAEEDDDSGLLSIWSNGARFVLGTVC